jgi:uncharacterized protein DUF3883
MSVTEAELEQCPAGVELLRIFDEELDTAALTVRRNQKIYSSVRQLSELIGGEYGDRVIYELLQNAHDAHPRDEPSEIAVRVVVHGPDQGTLYVANGGNGFSLANVQAIRNIATSTKEIGEGIGNKGVGFRSIEALTTNAAIYSRRGRTPVSRFDGFCFRFADQVEVERRAVALGYTGEAAAIAAAMPRYLAAVPIANQAEDILEFAERGFATVVVLPLETADAVRLATSQVEELVRRDSPVLLFLDRVKKLEIVIDGVGVVRRKRTLTRDPGPSLTAPMALPGCTIETVTLGPEKRVWLLARRVVAPDRIRSAVQRSLAQEPGLKRWLQWKGDAVVSLAVPLDGAGLKSGRLYNFLPMGAESAAPLFAHLDAPFFTAIDRRRAKLDLPLNAELMDASAEAAAAAALTITEHHPELSSRVVVDLAAWTSAHLPRLRAAFAAVGTAWPDAAIWPTMDRRWSPMRGLRTWPAGKYKVFTPARASSWGQAALLQPSLDPTRLSAVEALAKAANIRVEPTSLELAAWAEAVAKHLPTTLDAAVKAWGPFYTELLQAFGTPEALRALAGKTILLDRSESLTAAGPNVYVRQEGRRRSKSEGSPTPPRDVARVLNVLMEQIALRPEVFIAFERAGLWKRYDAAEILARLPSLFGGKPAPGRRRSALLWAFEVWRHDTAAARKVLPQAALHVPRRDGWGPATKSCFSETWTPLGRQLDAYLAEAKTFDPECVGSAASLLIGCNEWPEFAPALKAEWIRFLGDAGVVDGLAAVATPLPKGPYQGNDWSWRLSGASGPGLDQAWKANHGFGNTSHPYTNYSRQGEAWRVPGQTVWDDLSADARRRFAILVLQMLERTGQKLLWLNLGRFERDERHHDRQFLRTPLSTFLMTQSWIPVSGAGDVEFQMLRETWLVGDRRNDPRFVSHIPDDVAEYLPSNGKAYEVLSKPDFGLRVWRTPETCVARLETLAKVADGLEQSDRAMFRRQYDHAWRDALAQPAASILPRLAIERANGFACLEGGPDRPRVYVRSGRDRDLTRLLIETGTAVMVGSGEIDCVALVERLNRGERYNAALVEQGDIQLVVDGVPFEPNLQDALLTDVVPWLREAVLLAHELNARELEKSITSAMIDEKLSLVRVRLCDSIALCPTEGAPRGLDRYVYRDDNRPTLLFVGSLDAQQLADLAGQLPGLIHTNFRSLEPMLLRLAPRLIAGVPLRDLSPPSAEDYASALQAELEIVRDLLADRREDHSRLVDLIAPFVVYHRGLNEGLESLAQLRTRLRSAWLEVLDPHVPDAEGLLARLKETDDLALVRRERGLDYALFNRALSDLGRPTLASVADLQRQFDVWKTDLATSVLDRVRRSMLPRLSEPGVLTDYARYRTLDFLAFDPDWSETNEILEREDVKAHADRVLEGLFGPDPGGALPERDGLRVANRRIIAAFAQDAIKILSALPGAKLCEAWTAGPHEVAAAADRSGALDFKALGRDEAIQTLSSAGLWPEGVPQSLDLAVLGLRPEDLDRKERERLEAEREELRRRNSIEFGGRSFDTRAPNFASEFATLAEGLFGSSDWRARTRLRPIQLKPQPEADDSARRGGGSGGSGGKGRMAPKPPEPIRNAMGLAGELMAYHYLKARHRERFVDACWVSENRGCLFPELGDDRLGFDFRVATTETEWVYEVKATTGDASEFELTDNEYRVAALAAAERGRRYRILLVQHVFDLSRCRVLELPNPAGVGRSNYRIVGRSSVRLGFEINAEPPQA